MTDTPESPPPLLEAPTAEEKGSPDKELTKRSALLAVTTGMKESHIYNSKVLEISSRIINNGDTQTRQDVVDIIANGTLQGIDIPDAVGKSMDFRYNQMRLLSIYDQDPQVALALVENQVIGFHGTRSGNLLDILHDEGLLSDDELIKRGRQATTYEASRTPLGINPYLSFAAWAEPHTLRYYSGYERPLTVDDLHRKLEARRALYADLPQDEELRQLAQSKIKALEDEIESVTANPDSLQSRLILANYPVCFGLSGEGYDVYGVSSELPDQSEETKRDAILEHPYFAGGDDGEFVTVTGSPLSRLPVVATIKERIPEVRDLFREKGYRPDVIPLEPLREV
ncbi:MAG TPA: hypothetical protein VLF93_03070 [Candidatus Saccharimonadales bacterium]|nr:hypothetical protein [Candidatus Saccharimonadales bacterium]